MNGSANDVPNIQESRGYQREMLEESLKKNIVVAVQWHIHQPAPGAVTDSP